MFLGGWRPDGDRQPALRRTAEVVIPVSIECDLTDGWGGERWDVISVIDEREGHSLSDIGVYEFDAYSDFPETLLNAVINTLKERGELAVKENLY